MVGREELERLRSRFLKIYAMIPITLRDEIVAVIDEQPFSWSAVFVEVKGRTNKGNELLEYLDSLNLLGD